MTRDEILNLLTKAEMIFDQEENLIELESGPVVFVGDTHGDIEATEKVIEKHLNPENKLVFLGDYVDRGPASAENLNMLLSLKLEYPDNLFLLMGNHEGRKAIQCYPADFWNGLEWGLRQQYATVLSKLPLAVSTSNGIVALHGALPDVKRIDEINEIAFGSERWQQITWGDWQENSGMHLGNSVFTGRPQFGQGWFGDIMDRLGKNVLIRSHQPDARPIIYNRRCLTIFTSSAYRGMISQRTIAITDQGREVNSVDDLKFETV